MAESRDSEKRLSKCPGCKTPVEAHEWGFPSKFCEGFEKSGSPVKPKREESPADEEVLLLQRELADQESAIRRKQEVDILRQQIENNKELLAGHYEGNYGYREHTGLGMLTAKDLKKLSEDQEQRGTPLDDVLKPQCTGTNSQKLSTAFQKGQQRSTPTTR